ncbi:MAG TPA: DUF2537 domain-containing protein [Pseudonocardiaceae bacterium]
MSKAAHKVTGVPMPPGEPTPWSTGLPVSGAVAAIVGIALMHLSQGLEPNGGGFVALANLLVAAGLTPSIWLTRSTPVWRWISYGAAAGILLTWLTLLLSLLAHP